MDQSCGSVLTYVIFWQLHAAWILLQPAQNFRVFPINLAVYVSIFVHKYSFSYEMGCFFCSCGIVLFVFMQLNCCRDSLIFKGERTKPYRFSKLKENCFLTSKAFNTICPLKTSLSTFLGSWNIRETHQDVRTSGSSHRGFSAILMVMAFSMEQCNCRNS